MKLLYSPASPFVRMVLITAHETGTFKDLELQLVSTNALAQAPEVVAANPSGRIPALIRDEGPALYDSRVICRFLNARAKGSLYPETRLWEVLALEATAQAIAELSVSMTYEARLRPAEMQFAPLMDAYWQKIVASLDSLETLWMPHLAGPVDAGHIACASAFGYLDLRHDARGWRDGHPLLAAWYAKFSERKSMLETAPE